MKLALQSVGLNPSTRPESTMAPKHQGLKQKQGGLIGFNEKLVVSGGTDYLSRLESANNHSNNHQTSKHNIKPSLALS